MRKQLKIRGSTITASDAKLAKWTNPEFKDEPPLDVINLTITNDEGTWEYRLHKDDNVKNLADECVKINSALTQAKINFLNVEIPENKDRDYVTIKVKDNYSQQFTGRKIS